MAKKKPFNEMAGAIYEMHRTLVRMKQEVRTVGDSQTAQEQVMHQYADLMSGILEKVDQCTSAWLASLKEDSSP